MNSNEINFLMNDCADFQGVYSIDSLPNKLTGSLIFNHQSSNLSGSHWSCIRLVSNKEIYYFDPLAMPMPSIVTKYLSARYSLTYLRVLGNKKAVQSILSNTCGHHCIYYLRNGQMALNDREAYNYVKLLKQEKD